MTEVQKAPELHVGALARLAKSSTTTIYNGIGSRLS